ncbi:MAG: hypothetical protein QOJ41_214 [Acidobacteriaceae bacterium]|nr:hypothetical protein [Acidobacteriaceae bacterium]
MFDNLRCDPAGRISCDVSALPDSRKRNCFFGELKNSKPGLKDDDCCSYTDSDCQFLGCLRWLLQGESRKPGAAACPSWNSMTAQLPDDARANGLLQVARSVSRYDPERAAAVIAEVQQDNKSMEEETLVDVIWLRKLGRIADSYGANLISAMSPFISKVVPRGFDASAKRWRIYPALAPVAGEGNPRVSRKRLLA